jgi:hypothetical protein
MESIQMLPPRRVHQLHAGYVHDHGCAAPDPVKIARFQAEAAEHARLHKAERLSKGALAMVTAPSGLRQHRAILSGRSWIPRHDTRDPWHSTDVQRVSGRADRGIPRDWRGQGIPDSQSRHRGDPLGGAGGGRQRVAEQGSNKLGRWDPITREITEYQDNVRKHTVRIDPRTGYVWSTGAMTRFDPKTEKYDRISEAPSCYGIALDQQGNAWFTELLPNGKVDAKTLKVTKYTLPTANGRPGRIQVDDKGVVWFAEFDAGKIARLDPLGRPFEGRSDSCDPPQRLSHSASHLTSSLKDVGSTRQTTARGQTAAFAAKAAQRHELPVAVRLDRRASLRPYFICRKHLTPECPRS